MISKIKSMLRSMIYQTSVHSRIDKLEQKLFEKIAKDAENVGKKIESVDKKVVDVKDEIREAREMTIREVKIAAKYPDKIVREIRKYEKKLIRSSMQPRLSRVIAHIIDFCNLNCKGCNTFSPLADKTLVSHETIIKDLHQISSLTKNQLAELTIRGGEVLLHPNLLQVLHDARKIFPNADIDFITNGVLLLFQSDEFWNVCKDNKIKIRITKYPIDLDFDRIEQIAESNQIELAYFNNTGEITKTLYKSPMDPLGLQDPVRSFWDCNFINKCVVLFEGKIFPCPLMPGAMHFNRKFGTKMDIEEGDYFDIYKSDDVSELLEFLCKPKPFCRFCKITERIKGIPWEVSKREMSEWV